MSTDTADPAIVHPPREGILMRRSRALSLEEELSPQAPLDEDLSVEGERRVALGEVWRALWVSRLLIWAVGMGAVAILGYGPVRHALNPAGVTRGLGWLGDLLAAPAARWDAAWYLVIAHYGYLPELGPLTAPRTAFFPLYPLGIRALSSVGLPGVLAGVLLSMAALTAGLYGLHRLASLEATRLGLPDVARVARLAVWLCALAPMAFYFSAVYSESLYLALSVGVFLCARRGRFAYAAALAAFAAATRSTGVSLIVPLVLIYLYGPREDRPPEHRRPVEGWASRARPMLPRYLPRADAAWLALVPVGLGAYMGYLALAGGDPLAPFHAEAVWSRHFAGLYGGVWDGARAALAAARQLLSLQRQHVYYSVAAGSPFIVAGHNLMLFAFLLAAVPALIGVLRILPAAYGAYVLVALALPLSYPVAPQPLMSLPRFLLVLFPLTLWLAIRLAARPPLLARVTLVLSGALLAFFVAQFSTWHWVA